MMLKKLFFSLASLVVLLLSVCLSASAEELPVMVGNQGFPDITSALAVADNDHPVHVVADLHLTDDIHMISDTLIIDQGVSLYCGQFYIGVGADSYFYLYGNLVSETATSRITVGSGAHLYLYGNVYAPNGAFLSVFSPCLVEFNGCSVVCGDYAVRVSDSALSSTLLVNGGSFYSSTLQEPLTPLSAFIFPDGVDVQFQNGAVYAVSNVSVLSDIGRLVSSSVEWIHIFITQVSQSPMLFIFCIVLFSGLGIGLIKRLVRL